MRQARASDGSHSPASRPSDITLGASKTALGEHQVILGIFAERGQVRFALNFSKGIACPQSRTKVLYCFGALAHQLIREHEPEEETRVFYGQRFDHRQLGLSWFFRPGLRKVHG